MPANRGGVGRFITPNAGKVFFTAGNRPLFSELPMKKLLFVILFSLAPTLALAQTSTITLPTDFNANIFSQAQALLATNSIGGFAEAIIGVILAAIILEIIISALRK